MNSCMPSNCSSSIQRDFAQLPNMYYSYNEVITRNATEDPAHALSRKKPPPSKVNVFNTTREPQ